ncbi:MAG: ATPase [Parasphingorhabdus sp.]|uniref:F0F1 ATP synthase subunit B family protein n=1 Tax=Parasphingorhabdus sp. TaxID=2709688 RepID=UPI0032982CEE
MPQIDQIAATYGSQIFWLLLTFGFTFFVIGLGMFPKIQGTVDARDKRIADDLEAARAANVKADELEENYRLKMENDRSAAQALVEAGKDKANAAAEKRKTKANADIAAKITAAEADIRARTSEALKEIEGVSAEVAQDMVAKISGAKVTKAAALKETKAALKHG